MKNIICIPLITLLVIIISIFILISLRFYKLSKFSDDNLVFGEDKYHLETAKVNNGEISSPAICVLSLNVDHQRMVYLTEIICKRCIKFLLNYFKDYKSIYQLIINNKSKLVSESTTYNIYENSLTIMPLPMCLLFSYRERKIMMAMDHIYIGGYFFQEMATYVFSGEKIKPYKLNYTIGLTELNLIRFLIFDALPMYIRTNNDLPLLDNDDQIIRYSSQMDTKKLKEIYGDKNVKACIIHKLSLMLISYMSLKRNLNVMIPVAFQNNNYSFNNVGVIFLSINFTDTIDDIIKKIKNNLYQTSATNHLMQIANKGKKARDTIDAVMSIGYIKNPSLFCKNELSGLEVYFPTMSQYAIYIAAFTYDDISNITLSVMTKKFNTKSFEKNENNFKKIIKL